MRMLVALLVWAAAVAAVGELTHLADDYAHGGKAAKATADATPTPAATETSDLSRELPPRPKPTLRNGDPQSLLDRANLSRVLERMQTRFGTEADVVSFALYANEADFVIYANGGVEPVRAPADSPTLRIGAHSEFTGTRSVIFLRQLKPATIARALRIIVAKDDLPLDAIDRVVLDTESFGKDTAGYRIETKSGVTTYRTLLLGGPVTARTPGGDRQLR